MKISELLREVYVDDRNDIDTVSNRAFETSLMAKLVVKKVKELQQVEVVGSRIHMEFKTGDTARMTLMQDGVDSWVVEFRPQNDRLTMGPGALSHEDAAKWINDQFSQTQAQRKEDEAERAAG